MAKAKQRQWRKMLLNFIDNLRIVSREKTAALGETGTKIELWESQLRILQELSEGMDEDIRKFLVLKSRQLGSTTIFVIIALFWMALHPRIKGALVVDQDKTRDDFREQIRTIVESIPKEYANFRIQTDNKVFMKFSNGSQLNFLVAGTSGSKVSWGESSGYSLVLLSEVANYGSEDGLNNFEEAMSEVNPDRLYVYESTGKGYNLWHKRWLQGRADPFTTRCIFVGWWTKNTNRIKRSDPRFALYGLTDPDDRERTRIKAVKEKYGYDIQPDQLAWIRWRAAQPSQTEQSLNQNQPWVEEEAFVLSGKSFFWTRTLAQDLERIGDPEWKHHIYKGYRFWLGKDFWDGQIERIMEQERKHEIEMRVWAPPMAEGLYVIGMDPAGGSSDRNDRHVCSVWRCYADKLVQVAEYADNMSETRQAAWVLAYMAGTYKNCMINLELSGGYGKAVMAELESLKQQLRSEIYRERRSSTGADLSEFLDAARYYIYRKPDSPSAMGYILNFSTTSSLKNQILNQLRDAHINGIAVINSRPLVEEMLLVVQDGMTIEAPNHQKDDRVIAAALANHAYLEHFQANLIMQGMTYESVEARENGERKSGNIVNTIVSQYLREIEDAPKQMTPEQTWMMERGLA